jgi:hypothetical protein
MLSVARAVDPVIALTNGGRRISPENQIFRDIT